MTQELRERLAAESRRIEEDSDHSARSHYNAADRWGHYHLWIGLPATILAAVAGGAAFNNCQIIAVALSIIVTALTTVLTFLKPSERAEIHKSAADQFLGLRNKSRLFREVELSDATDMESVKAKLLELAAVRDELNRSSPGIPREDYEKAKRDIDSGSSQYRVDMEGK
ncbi:MAG: SLATT domain-containing protein [Candidatus Thiodiazotropha sp. (ex Myrtea sp. 'scaly one' KF741663)]|nr:SLATT domain-containing protein [Candidatus Thiodiazotropha sp. (ex Myrtea sp. 'scaly one' KF741663)]